MHIFERQIQAYGQKGDIYIAISTSGNSKNIIKSIEEAKKMGLKTILTGCVAQIEKEKLLQESFIDAVYGNEDKFNIVELLKKEEDFAVIDLMNKKEFCNVILNDTTKTARRAL